MLTIAKEAGAMKEAFLVAAVCVMIFSAIARYTELLTTPFWSRLNRCDRRK